MSNEIHNYSKNTLALPEGPKGERKSVKPGCTIEIDDAHAKVCAKDPGFKHWVDHKLVGAPPEDVDVPELEGGDENPDPSGDGGDGDGGDAGGDAANKGGKGGKAGAKQG